MPSFSQLYLLHGLGLLVSGAPAGVVFTVVFLVVVRWVVVRRVVVCLVVAGLVGVLTVILPAVVFGRFGSVDIRCDISKEEKRHDAFMLSYIFSFF